jgi:hypothetical protein
VRGQLTNTGSPLGLYCVSFSIVRMDVVTQCSLLNTRVCCVVSYGVASLLCTVEILCVARVGGRPGASSWVLCDRY